MQLTRYYPRHRRGLRNTLFPALLDDFFAPVLSSSSPLVNQFVPSVDIYERDEKVIFEAEVPGFNKEDLKIDVKGKLVTLSGERTVEREEDENSYRKERRYGKFERSFHLGFEADSESVVAKYENGILTIEVPKPQEIQAKQITIS